MPAPHPMMAGPKQDPDIRFEIAASIALPHSTEVHSDELNEYLENIEGWFRRRGAEVTISFVRTTKGNPEASDSEPKGIDPDRLAGHGSYM